MLTAYHPIHDYPTSARDVEDYGATYAKLDRFPMKAGEYDRAQPLYPYPAYAKYTGEGDPSVPSSYTKAMP